MGLIKPVKTSGGSSGGGGGAVEYEEVLVNISIFPTEGVDVYSSFDNAAVFCGYRTNVNPPCSVVNIHPSGEIVYTANGDMYNCTSKKAVFSNGVLHIPYPDVDANVMENNPLFVGEMRILFVKGE